MASFEKLSKQRYSIKSYIRRSCSAKVSIPFVCPVGISASCDPVILDPSTDFGFCENSKSDTPKKSDTSLLKKPFTLSKPSSVI